MISILVEIVSKIRQTSARDPSQNGSGDRPNHDVPPAESGLFKCQECNVVYIATEKSTCGNCDETTELVEEPAEL